MARVRLDMHTHTRSSPDALDAPEEMVRAAKAAGLDGIAITDHDRGCGYARLVELGLADRSGMPVDGFLIIPGVEVSTLQGHVLVLGESFDVPARSGAISAEALVRQCRHHGLLSIAAHPFACCRAGVGRGVLDDVEFDAIEVFNSKCLGSGENVRAALYASQHGIPGVAGSDAHFAQTVGRAHTIVDTQVFSVQRVLEAIRHGQTAIHPGVHTPGELGQYLLRGWFTRPWIAEWVRRTAIGFCERGQASDILAGSLSEALAAVEVGSTVETISEV